MQTIACHDILGNDIVRRGPICCRGVRRRVATEVRPRPFCQKARGAQNPRNMHADTLKVKTGTSTPR